MPLNNVDSEGLNRVSNIYTNCLKDYMYEGPDSGCSTLSSWSHNSLASVPAKSVLTRGAYHPGMGTTKYELEDYIYEMECRQADAAKSSTDQECQDVHERLAKKEQDLILAAELGKALLDRNEILVQENERLAEDYSHKLEVLEQEKHSIRRKFAATEGEYEVRLQELSVDFQCAKDELEELQEHCRQSEREKAQILEELTEQNQRLTKQLKETSKSEEHLNQQIKSLKDQFSVRKSTMTDQVSTLEVLRDEINLLSEKKHDLERRIDSLSVEREGLSVTLDESTDRILMLERKSREKELMLQNSQRDLEELRHTNVSLTDRLEAISRNSSSPSMGHTSLMNEMDLSDPEASRPSLPEDLLELDEDIDCDDPVLSPISDAHSLKQLRQEAVETTSQLRSLSDQIRHQRRNSLTSISTNSSDEFNAVNFKSGMLTSSAKELTGLVRQVLRREAKGKCSSCGGGTEDEAKLQVEQEMHKACETLDKLNIELTEVKEKLKSKIEEASRLEQQIILKDAERKAVEEERDNLKHDLSNTHLAKDELIKKAWDMRDSAVARKNNCEIELARTRIDVMQVNSQLMEAVQQKVELSQQLDQWQVDMQQLLDDQMRRKLDRLENSGVLNCRSGSTGSDSDSSTSKSPKRNFSFLAILSHLRRSHNNNRFSTTNATTSNK